VGGAVGHLKSPLKSTLKWESGKAEKLAGGKCI